VTAMNGENSDPVPGPVGVDCPEGGRKPYPSRDWRGSDGPDGIATRPGRLARPVTGELPFDRGCDDRNGEPWETFLAGSSGCVGGLRALPCIRPRSHEPVEDSESRDRLERFGMGTGRGDSDGLGIRDVEACWDILQGRTEGATDFKMLC